MSAEIKSALEALSITIPPPRYICETDAVSLLAIAERLVSVGARPRVYVARYNNNTVCLTEYNREGEWIVKCYCRCAEQAECTCAEIADAIAVGRMRYEERAKAQMHLPGFEELEGGDEL